MLLWLPYFSLWCILLNNDDDDDDVMNVLRGHIIQPETTL